MCGGAAVSTSLQQLYIEAIAKSNRTKWLYDMRNALRRRNRTEIEEEEWDLEENC